MFTLTPFAPTATASLKPIPPLSPETQVEQAKPLPSWIEAVSPAPGSQASIGAFEGICVAPAGHDLTEYAPALASLFRAGERARDHLYVKVNGIVPSELTWKEIIVPNSTNPGTAWLGIRTYYRFCWVADIVPGLYQVMLFYPTETRSDSLTWHFVLADR
jgi:hypothetical protein